MRSARPILRATSRFFSSTQPKDFPALVEKSIDILDNHINKHVKTNLLSQSVTKDSTWTRSHITHLPLEDHFDVAAAANKLNVKIEDRELHEIRGDLAKTFSR